MEETWLDKMAETWINQVKTYPDKAIIYMAKIVYLEQKKRLENKQGQLDGSLWSPKDWK